jgi:hypothetical protein
MTDEEFTRRRDPFEDLLAAPEYKALDDFKPYNESIIWQISDQYYRSKGIMAWSNKAPKIIPHKIGTNYQSAIALVKLVQANLKLYPSITKIDVLECGAGSGRFSRHFLLAARELGILDRVTLLVTDYSKNSLEEIRSRGILQEFKEGEDYKLLVLDIVSDSLAFENNIRAIFLHYVLDALPMTILRWSEQAALEELYLSTSKRDDQLDDVLGNDFLQARLEHTEKWQPYDWQQQSEAEKLYKSDLLEYYHNSKKEIFYSYAALQACDNLMRLLDKDGFLLSVDIIPNRERSFRFAVVGNSIAHEVDNGFLLNHLEKQTYLGMLQNDTKNISRLLVTKNPGQLAALKPTYNELFIENNLILKYLELEKQADEFTGTDTNELKLILEELTKLAPHNAFTYELWARYYKNIGDDSSYQEALKKAKAIDYWGDL